MPAFGTCDKCNKWGDAPKDFRESKHFLKCPNCGNPMYLTRIFHPTTFGFKESEKVEITEFIKHNG